MIVKQKLVKTYLNIIHSLYNGKNALLRHETYFQTDCLAIAGFALDLNRVS